MPGISHRLIVRCSWLVFVSVLAFMFAGAVLMLASSSSGWVNAAQEEPVAPIPPPDGYPKFSQSVMMVSPGLVNTGGQDLTFRIEIINTGAYAAHGVQLINPLPAGVSYNNDAQSDTSPQPVVSGNQLTWSGNVGFDKQAVISYSVMVDVGFSGIISNTAVINHPLIPAPVSLSAQAVVTDGPIFTISKTAYPEKPGPGKTLEYALQVTNIGQPAVGIPVTVIDEIPLNTTFHDAGQGGQVTPGGVVWQQPITLSTGATQVYTFSVGIAAIPSGTIITNQTYQVDSTVTGVAVGDPYAVTVVDPEFFISKTTWPDPPGSNRELTYTLTVLNRGSLATDIEVTDRLPDGVSYVRGGDDYKAGVVSWNLPELGTGEVAEFSYVVYVGDVAQVTVQNSQYGVCSLEGACAAGDPLDSLVQGPQFDAEIWLDPVAKKPGGGTGPVTPTIVIRNLGPGSALDADAQLIFQRISVSKNDLMQIPPVGQFFDGPDCGEKCVSYRWVGDLAVGEVVTLTTDEGQSTIGGEEGTYYTATLVMIDQLGSYTTEPYTATAYGKITHYANLIPSKSAPEVIGAGQVMTYVLQVYNSGLSTDVPPYPVLTDTVPASTTLVRISDGGSSFGTGQGTVISWTLPAMSPGDRVYRSFAVQVDSDLISGTQIYNNLYATKWYEIDVSGYFSNTGEPVTTTVMEVGLIDSFKTVNPKLAYPGEGTVLTYTVHVVNSSPSPLSGVHVYDVFPWEHSTYLRDAVASSGSLLSDIVSLDWTGNVAANSQELITFTVLVDPYFEGLLTNTVTIDHSSLREPVQKTAVAYITDQPVLRISKTASPDPVTMDEELTYKIQVENLGQQATVVVVTDTLPANTSYVPGSATAGGQLQGDTLRWTTAVLVPGEVRTFSFRVTVLGGMYVINGRYRVSCSEGASAVGEPVVTEVDMDYLFMPVIYRSYSQLN